MWHSRVTAQRTSRVAPAVPDTERLDHPVADDDMLTHNVGANILAKFGTGATNFGVMKNSGKRQFEGVEIILPLCRTPSRSGVSLDVAHIPMCPARENQAAFRDRHRGSAAGP